MNDILLQTDFKRFCYVIGFEIIFQFNKIDMGVKKTILYNVKNIKEI